MKQIVLVLAILLLAGCATFGTEDQGAQTGLDDEVTGGTITAAKWNAVKNTADTADALATVNEGHFTTLHALIGPVFSDGDGTYTDMSAVSATELGYLDGVTSAIQDQIDAKAAHTGQAYTGAHNLGGATSLEIPNGTDPDVDAEGEVSYDTDGANVTGDEIVRGFDGTNQWPIGKKLQTIQLPFTTAGAVTNWQPWFNLTGMTFTITNVYFRSDTDDLAVEIDECTSTHNMTILNTIHQSAVGGTVSTDGTNVYYLDVAAGSLDSTTIETTHGLSFDFGGAAEGLIIIEGWFDANVD